MTPSEPTVLPTEPRRFVMHFVKQFRWAYLAVLLLQSGSVIFTLGIPWALGQITRLVTQGTTPNALIWPMAGFVALLALEMFSLRLASWISVRNLPKLRRAVTHTLFGYLQRHSHRFISSEFAGALAHRISEVSMGTSQTLVILIFDLIPLLVTLVLSVVLLSSADGWLGLAMGAWAAGFLTLCWFLARRSHPLARAHSAARSTTTGKVVDAVTNLSNVRLFARHRFEHTYLGGYLDEEVAAAHRSLGYMERIRWLQNLCGVLLKAGMLGLSLWLWQAGRIDVATFVMASSLSMVIISDVTGLSRRLMELFEASGNIANGVRTLVRPHDITDAPQAQPLKVERGEIRFEHLSFGYLPGRPVFENLDLRIAAGQRVGLVGASGSGKSTLLNLLLRLYDVDSGRVLIDGQDIREVTQQSLHQQIGLIPQDPGLFHRSIRENIHYGRLDADEADLLAATERAGAHGFIEGLEHGYDSLVGERGVKLSGGQRQRIAIARVLLKNAPILVMDEATSSLDSLTERYIQEKLDEIMDRRTVIVVAHRLSTVAHLDRIVVFDQGRLVEDGTHGELLAQQGYYWRLWTRQQLGAESELA